MIGRVGKRWHGKGGRETYLNSTWRLLLDGKRLCARVVSEIQVVVLFRVKEKDPWYGWE